MLKFRATKYYYWANGVFVTFNRNFILIYNFGLDVVLILNAPFADKHGSAHVCVRVFFLLIQFQVLIITSFYLYTIMLLNVFFRLIRIHTFDKINFFFFVWLFILFVLDQWLHGDFIFCSLQWDYKYSYLSLYTPEL